MKALSQQFGVSERTIYRDKETLLELGVPVEGEAGTGFILRPGFFLPSMAFTRDEADALLLGLRFILARGDPQDFRVMFHFADQTYAVSDEGIR